MSDKRDPPVRYIGLDVHKHYLVAYGVDKEKNRVYGPKRVGYADLDDWIGKDLNAGRCRGTGNDHQYLADGGPA